MSQIDTLHGRRPRENEVRVMTTNEFYVAIVLIHTARLLDKRLDRRVLIELSSGARFDRAFAGVGSRRTVLGRRLGRKIVGCDERD